MGFLVTPQTACGQSARAGERIAEKSKRPLFLSGTPTEHSDFTYRVVLYAKDAAGKLKTVREVVPVADGLHSVQSWGDVIFIVHPHTIPKAVDIIDLENPSSKDEVVFNSEAFEAFANPRGSFVSDTRIAVTLSRDSYPSILFPLSTNFADPSKGRLVRVSSHLTTKVPRITFDSWNEYAALRFEGVPGGPDIPAGLLGATIGKDIGIVVSGHATTIASLPRDLEGVPSFTPVWIVASSADYLVLRQNLTADELNSANAADSMQVFVLKRTSSQWSTIRIEGNTSRSRLCGSWLATIVAKWNPTGKASPGRDSERNSEQDGLPNVRDLYTHFEGKTNWLPGVLTLQNLADGRKIRIETGQEDSEILRVEGDVMLYRVNDEIYQARIVGDQLKETTLIVKDEDVPEIHWAFWSK